ncbi:MAG: hypothetical protein HY219_01455 [Candidatus Staskawiczbacteria bacterium]|nr:hypothetical protein [Candidatus Staskawiczbacteria bacterium]
MKKYFLLISLFFLFLVPVLANAQAPLVPCGNPGQNPCIIEDFFIMLDRIFNFIVYFIATPLAILMLTIGGIMILISAGNPTLASKGKNILYLAIIGLALVFCSWLIINFILTTLGYQGAWNSL